MFTSLFVLGLMSRGALSSDTYCLAGITNMCNLCAASILQPNNTCVPPQTPVENCLVYAQDQSCEICVYGFKLIDRSCKKIKDSEDCIFTHFGNCNMCRKKKLLMFKGKSCSKTKTCQKEHVDYCGFFAFKEFPLICEEGYMPNSDAIDPECVKVPETLNNCELSYDMINCYQCRVNYYIENGRCLKSPSYYFDLDWMKVEQIRSSVL